MKMLHWLGTYNMTIQLVNMTPIVDNITSINLSSQLAVPDIAKVP